MLFNLQIHTITLSKGKTRDKLNNLILFNKSTYDKLLKEVLTRWETPHLDLAKMAKKKTSKRPYK